MILQILLEPRSSNALAMMAAFIEPVFASVMMMKLCGEDDLAYLVKKKLLVSINLLFERVLSIILSVVASSTRECKPHSDQG